MRVLILGATSLIGNNTLRAAIAAGWDVIAFDRPNRRRQRHPALHGLEVCIASGEQVNPEDLRQAMMGCDVVFHTDGYAPPNSLHHRRRLIEARQHIEPILQAAEMASVGRLVYTSSVSTIGRPDSPTRLPDEWNRYRLGQVHHPYWDAKLVQEEAVLALSRRGRIPVTVLNVSATMGPFDFDFRSTRPLLEMVTRGVRQYMPGRVSLADARDVAQGHIAAAEKGRPGERYILAGHNITQYQMLTLMARACKRPPPDKEMEMGSISRWTRFSERVSCLGRPSRPFPASYQLEVIRQCHWYDSGRARDELGYANRPLIGTFRATLAWLKEIGKLK